MTEPKIVIPDTERGEEVVVQVPLPDSTSPDPKGIVTTERTAPIKRGVPLRETHGMTTEANRFKET